MIRFIELIEIYIHGGACCAGTPFAVRKYLKDVILKDLLFISREIIMLLTVEQSMNEVLL